MEVWILQHADDALFFCEPSMQSTTTLKCILKGFELAVGLKVNFCKSNLFGIGVEERYIIQYASL